MSTQRMARQKDPPPHLVTDEGETTDRGSSATEVLTWVVLSICLAVWTVTGFFLWIPRLLRAMVLFSLALIQSTVVDASGEDAARGLRSAASFYWRGFLVAVESVRATKGEDSSGSWGIERELFLRELAWALVVWYPLLWWVGFVEWTPADLWQSIQGIPWTEMGTLVAGYVEEIPRMLGN